MPRITLPPAGLVLLAGLADVAGAHSLAFYALVAAVPAAAAAALVALDHALRTTAEHWPVRRAWLQAAVLMLVLLSAAVRAPLREEGVVSQLATSALVGCLVLIAAQTAAAWLRSASRRQLPRLHRPTLRRS